MPVVLIQIRHKEFGVLSNTPANQLARYEASGWERVKDAEPSVQSPVTVATGGTEAEISKLAEAATKAETGKHKES